MKLYVLLIAAATVALILLERRRPKKEKPECGFPHSRDKKRDSSPFKG